MKSLCKPRFGWPWRAESQRSAFAQNPNKPIKIIVPLSGGGTTDIMARAVARRPAEGFGQAVVVENRRRWRATSAPTRCQICAGRLTPLMGTVGTHAINMALYAKMPYDAVKDFAPVSLVAAVPNIPAATPSFPVNSVKELIDLAKKEDGKLALSRPAARHVDSPVGRIVQTTPGVQMTHVP